MYAYAYVRCKNRKNNVNCTYTTTRPVQLCFSLHLFAKSTKCTGASARDYSDFTPIDCD